MSKDTYFFSHDAHARRDPKMIAMMSVYGVRGYGFFWILVEMMREQDGYKLDISKKYSMTVVATELNIENQDAEDFIDDCVEEFGLFKKVDGFLISESLMGRMKHLDDKRAQAKAAADARWSKQKNKNKKKEEEFDLFADPKEKKPSVEEVFLAIFNTVKKEAIPTSKGHESLSTTAKRNLKKLVKRNFSISEFEKAAIVMFQNKWVYDTGNTGPAHLLIEDNFDRYHNQAVEKKVVAKVATDKVESYDDIMNG